MKNSTIIIVTLGIVCLSVAIIKILNAKNGRKDQNQTSHSLPYSHTSTLTVTDQNALANNEIKVPENLLLKDENRMILLKDALDSRKKNLIFRVDDAYCIDCIDSCINQLEKSVDTAKLKVIVIGKFQNRQSREFFRQKLKKFTAFYVLNELPLPGEEAIQPYFFTLNVSFHTQDSFFPNKDKPNAIKKYLISQMKSHE